MVGMSQVILLEGLHFVKAITVIIANSLQKSKQALKGTSAKRDVCRGSSESSGAKFLVDPAESAPMTAALLGV